VRNPVLMLCEMRLAPLLMLRVASTYPGKWHAVSGGLERGAAGLELPFERALKEIEVWRQAAMPAS
jgi:hypothetical protein